MVAGLTLGGSASAFGRLAGDASRDGFPTSLSIEHAEIVQISGTYLRSGTDLWSRCRSYAALSP
jgi:hypothetical protein